MRLFGYPYNNDLVICKKSPDYTDYLDWLALHLKFGSVYIKQLDEISRHHVDQLQIWEHAHIAWSALQCRALKFFWKSSIFIVKNEI